MVYCIILFYLRPTGSWEPKAPGHGISSKLTPGPPWSKLLGRGVYRDSIGSLSKGYKSLSQRATSLYLSLYIYIYKRSFDHGSGMAEGAAPTGVCMIHRPVLYLQRGVRKQLRKEKLSNCCLVQSSDVGGWQNVGPLLCPLNTRCRIILRTPKGPIILTTTHMAVSVNWDSILGVPLISWETPMSTLAL